MNYIREINAFYDWLETNGLSLSAIALWHALMHVNNKAAWTDEFAVAISVLCVKTGLSPRGVSSARNELAQKGRIKWKQRRGNQSAVYSVIPLSARMQAINADNGADNNPENHLSAMSADNHTDNRADNRADNHTDNRAALYKLNETKQNEENIIAIFDHWNSKEIILHRKLSDKMRGHINARLGDYSIDEIIAAIDNYDTVLRGDEYFFSYRWKLDEFLLRGLEKFLTESKPLVNFLKDKQPNGQRSHEDKVLVDEQKQKKKEFIRSLYMS